MSMFGGMEISASALTAQRLRMNVTAENLANAETTKGADGNPYRRKEVVLQSVSNGGFGSQLSAAMGASDARNAIERTGFTTQADRTVGATRADGGTIDIDAESAKLAANALEQQAAVSVAKTRNAILRSAMGVG